MATKAVIHITDNSLPEPLASYCREVLVKEAGDIEIISVSQKPITLGKNICVGETGRNWLSIYKQQLAGAEATDADYVGICEHDCLYTHEHLAWIPPTDDTFYYNHNCWLLQLASNHPELKGMYSYIPRRYALSQLVCNRKLLIESLKERLDLLQGGFVLAKGMAGAGEFGVKDRVALAQRMARNGSHRQTGDLIRNELTVRKARSFATVNPNVDIRHDSNFTGARRGKKRCYELPYWGKFKWLQQ